MYCVFKYFCDIISDNDLVRQIHYILRLEKERSCSAHCAFADYFTYSLETCSH